MKLSVIVPAFNAAAFISKTLDSICDQQDPVHEVIVVDDGSNDNTADVVRAYAKRATPQIVVIEQENQGVSAARNSGLKVASGDYIVFLDADDLIAPSLVRTLTNCLTQEPTTPDAIAWPYNRITQDGEELWTHNDYWTGWREGLSTGPEMLIGIIRDATQFIHVASIAYRTTFLHEHGFVYTTGCTAGEDVEFIWKALAVAGPVIWVNEVLSSYVARTGSATDLVGPQGFDDVRSYQRISKFLAEHFNQSFSQVSEKLSAEIVRHYMIHAKSLCQARITPRHILSQIEDRHPGLTQEIRRMILASIRNGLATRGEKLFALSPYLYLHYLIARGKYSNKY